MSDGHRRSFVECPGHRITVLGSFGLTSDGASVPLSVDARRVVAYLAVHRRPQPRAGLAADLWPGVPAEAAARLLGEAVAAVDVPGLLVEGTDTLALADEVEVDLSDAMLLVRAFSGGGRLDERPATELLSEDILPSWTSPWIAVERERFRQLRLASLEEISLKLTAAGLHAAAVEVAEIAVAAAPSRESARRALVEALLAKGDVVEAVAQYDAFQELLRTSVGPQSAGLEGLLAPAGGFPMRPAVGGYRPVPSRSAVVLPGLRAARPATPGAPRRLVAGGSVR
jgi:DNA-binding SARP family transcriptional activator